MPSLNTGNAILSNAITVDSSYNVGIGQATPSYKLDVTGTGRFTGALTIGNLDGEVLKLQEATSTGNSYLRFYSSAGSGLGYIGSFNNGGTQYLLVDGSGTDLSLNGNANLLLRTGGTERIRINSSGNVGIGTSSPSAPLEVVNGLTVTQNPFPQLLLRTVTDTNRQLLVGYDYTNNYATIQSIQQGVAYRSLYLNPNGGAVYAGGVRLDTLSDGRVKDNIQSIDGALSKVLAITGKKFHLKDEEEGKIRYGFIAQELEGILDEFVVQTDMTFKKDDLEVPNVKSIENWASSWAALLVEAIKELKAEIDELKNK